MDELQQRLTQIASPDMRRYLKTLFRIALEQAEKHETEALQTGRIAPTISIQHGRPVAVHDNSTWTHK